MKHFQESDEKVFLDSFQSIFGVRKHHAHSRNNKIFTNMLFYIICYNFIKYKVVSWVWMYFSIRISEKNTENQENKQIFKNFRFFKMACSHCNSCNTKKFYIFSESYLTQWYYYRFLVLNVHFSICAIFWAK